MFTEEFIEWCSRAESNVRWIRTILDSKKKPSERDSFISAAIIFAIVNDEMAPEILEEFQTGAMREIIADGSLGPHTRAAYIRIEELLAFAANRPQ